MAARRKGEDGSIIHIEPLVFKHTANGDLFVEWFRRKLVKSLPKGCTAIMDNATHHPKKKLANLAKRHGIKLLFLPTYSPDLNPIEKDWANMKRGLVEIMRMDGMDDLESGIYWYFGVERF